MHFEIEITLFARTNMETGDTQYFYPTILQFQRVLVSLGDKMIKVTPKAV